MGDVERNAERKAPTDNQEASGVFKSGTSLLNQNPAGGRCHDPTDRKAQYHDPMVQTAPKSELATENVTQFGRRSRFPSSVEEDDDARTSLAKSVPLPSIAELAEEKTVGAKRALRGIIAASVDGLEPCRKSAAVDASKERQELHELQAGLSLLEACAKECPSDCFMVRMSLAELIVSSQERIMQHRLSLRV